MKYILVFVFILFFPIHSIAKEESLSPSDKEWLEGYVRKTDYAARLRLISIVILDDTTKMKENDYYAYIETYKVIETYKGNFPDYILVKSFGEYHKKYDNGRYILRNRMSINGLCKGESIFYFPETHVSDTGDEILNIYRTESEKAMVKGEKSLCKSGDVRGR